MDRKSIIVLALCFILIVSWGHILHLFYPNTTTSSGSPLPVAGASNGMTASNASATAIASNAPAATNIFTGPARFVAHTEIPEELLVITNNNGRYTFTSRGGGLKEVVLVGYPETVSSRRKKGQPTNQWAKLNDADVPPVFAMIGDEALQGDGVFKLTPTSEGVRAEKSLANGLTVVKDFQLGTNFLVITSIRFENRSQQAIAIPSYQWIAGTATPMSPLDNGMAEAVTWYNGSKSQSGATLGYFNTNTTVWGFFSHVPKTEYVAGSNDVVWSSAQNQFFTLAAMPDKAASNLVVHIVDLPPPTPEDLKEHPNANRNPKGLEVALTYPGFTILPGGVLTNRFNLFAGPKEYETLAKIAARFNNDIDQVMGWGWYGAISKILLITINWLHSALALPYGWLIILITVIIKVVFWPLTQASVRSSKRMQALQPQLKALQEKYKDDPQKLPAKQWELYKKNHVNPMSGCLPMLLQVPVFIGFYGMLRTAIELRGASFLWIGDLSNPDTVYSLFLPFHFLGFSDHYFPINPMPLIMGVTLLWQARMAPVSPGMDPSQQQMMKYMPLMMMVFFYNLSSGLALYYTVNNLLTILQTRLTKTQTGPGSGPTPEPAKAVAPAALQKRKK